MSSAAAILSVVLAGLHFAAQTPKALQTRDEIISEIRQMAERHVKGNQSMDTSAVLSVYEPYTTLVTRREIAETYESTFLAANSRRAPHFWSIFKPTAGWVVAAILFVFTLFKTQVEKVAEIAAERFVDFISKRFVRVRYVRNANLRRYRRGLINHHSQLKVPFLPNPLVLTDIFIPLRVTNAQRVLADIDALAAIRDYRRLVITGNPGAGKTVLLNYVALTFAQGPHRGIPENVVPILFPLYRVRETPSEESLRSDLAEELRRCGMPAPSQFLDAALREGTVMLLFDGLDEVSQERRPLLVEAIRDLLRTHHRCPAIITCRSAVYDNDLHEVVDEHLTIVDFQDYQILAFLYPWEKEMPKGRSVGHLIKTLRERPRILSMARNPLQLTMICSLYTDEREQFTMPHSRTEFYQRSTQLFLGEWHKDQNHFERAHKAAVLERLAMHLHEVGGTSASDSDKRSLPMDVALAQVSRVMKGLSYADEKDSQRILDEIVKRSGLLLRIDGGARYQFAHLTIQEYYAAQALVSRPETLLKHYQTDAQHWREVLRLWCGLDHDCSNFVQALFDLDAVMALECVADARRIEDHIASKVTNYFQENVEAKIVSTQSNVREAYAAVASSPSTRGSAMLTFLGGVLSQTEDDETRQATADVLSATNADAAARMIFDARQRFASLAPALISMGDLAVPQLKPLVDAGNLIAIDDIFSIGTPNAATVLVPRLWDSSETVRYRAAWALASLLARREVEQALSNYPLTGQMLPVVEYDWVWAPFCHPNAPSLSTIAGNIVYCLALAEEAPEFVRGRQLDPRLASAVVFVARLSEAITLAQLSRKWDSSTKSALADFIGVAELNIESTLRGTKYSIAIPDIWDALLQHMPEKASFACLLRSLPLHLLFDLTPRVFASNLTDLRGKWKTMHHPAPRPWWLWGSAFATIVALMPLLVPTFLNFIPSLWIRSSGVSWGHLGISTAAVMLLLGCLVWIIPVVFYSLLFEKTMFFGELEWCVKRWPLITKVAIFLLGPLVASACSVFGIVVCKSQRGRDEAVLWLGMLSTIFCAPALLAILLASFQIWDCGWLAWGSTYCVVMATLFALENAKTLVERKNSNPLRGVKF